jgi:hypothetical protein
MLDLLVFNSYLLSKVNTRRKIKFVNYHLQLIREILQTYNVPKPTIGHLALIDTFHLLYFKQQTDKLIRKNVLYLHTHWSKT